MLLVDDDATSSYLAELLITRNNISQLVVLVQNGEEALNYLHAQHNATGPSNYPDIILLDINMPVMDGFQFLEALRENPNLPQSFNIVMLTSSGAESDMEHARKFEISDYLVKPLTTSKLQDLVQKFAS